MPELDYLINFSQEHATLPLLEIESCLKSEKIKYEIKDVKKSLCIITSSSKICEKITKRLAYTYDCGLFLFKSNIKIETIAREIKNMEFNFIKLLKNKRFRITIKDLISRNKYSESFERNIGKIIKDLTKNQCIVNLKNPEIEFLGYILDEIFYFAIKVASSSRNTIIARKLKERPFVHPSAMNQLLSHAMINLSNIKTNSILLDPFCGTGTVLIESFFLKLRPIGMDINKEMLKGTLKNLNYFNIQNIHLIQGTIKSLMFPKSKIDAIVSDPPYGRSSSTHKTSLNQLISDFFQNSIEILRKESYICIALPNNFNIVDFIDKNRLKIEQEILYYVHKSLTRKIWVIKKK